MLKTVQWPWKRLQETPITRQKSGDDGNNNSGRSKVHKNYQDYQGQALKDQELRRQMAAKALDMPYDTMGDINVTKTEHNYQRRGVLPWVLGSLLAGGSLVWGLPFLKDALNKNTPAPVQDFTDNDTRFFLDFGEVLDE